MPKSALAALFALVLLAACSSDPGAIYSDGALGPDGQPLGEGIGDPRTTTTELDPFAQAGEGVADPGTQADFEINVGDRVYFGYDGVTLDDEAQGTLDRQAAWLQQYDSVTVTIEGHTDERGTNDYNLALGERRSAAVKNYLVALGVEPARLLTISYGEERPVDPAHDDEAYAQNRRAVTIVNVVN